MWREEDSDAFIDYGRYFVPQRERQIDIIGRLIPPREGSLRMLELACGEGLLAESLLLRFPGSTLLGLDGSETMIRAAERRLQPFGHRFEGRYFDLANDSWRNAGQTYHAVVSSLTIHHLDGSQKAQLFRDVYGMLADGGIFIIADIIQPADEHGVRLAADEWDEAVKQRAKELDGNYDAFDHFQQAHWNLFRHPDPIDKPSTINEQLHWLEDASFQSVDVHWLQAGHAIFGGRKATIDNS